jgi:hypothetical protein
MGVTCTYAASAFGENMLQSRRLAARILVQGKPEPAYHTPVTHELQSCDGFLNHCE